MKKLPKNLPIYPLFLGEAPQLFVFVLVLSISCYGGGGRPNIRIFLSWLFQKPFSFIRLKFTPCSPKLRLIIGL